MELFPWGKSKSGTTRFETEDMPVSQSMIWICEKCGSKLSRSDNESPSRDLQKAIKHLLSENKEKRNIRVMVSGCMNICPKEKIAASIIDLKGGKTRFVSFPLGQDLDQLAQDIYKEVR